MLLIQQCSVGLMQFLESLTDRTPLFAADVAAGAVAGRFAQRPGSCAFPVIDSDGAVIGLADRTAVLRAVADGQADRAVGELMSPPPLALDSALSAREALGLVLAHPAQSDQFLVMDGRECLGVCTLRVLTQALLAYEPPAVRTAEFDQAVTEEVQRLYQAVDNEFRAQAQSLIAMTDRLQRQPLGVDALAQVQSIRGAGETLLRLAGDAKDMILARQGRLQLDVQAQSLRALMDRVQERWAARARDAGVGLLISYDGDPDLSAVIDADRLTQVFDNLIDNALRYTRRGSVEAALRARTAAGRVKLEGRVCDTAEDASGVDFDGPSLPLSLARGILASMNGEIRAESNPGQGVTVQFDLTAEVAEAPAAEVEERPASGAAHVLVVDDNATNRMVAEGLCEMFDCTSECAEDGEEAVEAARNGRFDLILMDIKMPRMDGMEATRAIRKLPGEAGQVPIIALTANADPEDAKTYIACGMSSVVEKPIKPERLLDAMKGALDRPVAEGGAFRAA